MAGSVCRLQGRSSPRGPRPARPTLLLWVVVMGLGASIGLSRPVPDTILLPDSLGPLYDPYHLAVGGSRDNIYIASGTEDIIVVDRTTFARIKRIRTGTPIGDVCLVSQHDKLYLTYPVQGQIAVVDCATNAVTGTIAVGARPKKLCYDYIQDKVYCVDSADGALSAVVCAKDSVVATIAVGTGPGSLVFDPTTDKVYVATEEALVSVDCTADTVATSITEIPGARALCCSRRNQKLYAVGKRTGWDTIAVVYTPRDSIVAKITHARFLNSLLACNDATNRVYAVDSSPSPASGRVEMIDGSGDTIIRTGGTQYGYYEDIMCDTIRNLIYLSGHKAGWGGAWIDVVDGRNLLLIDKPDAGMWATTLALDTARRTLLCASGDFRWVPASMLVAFNCDDRSYAAAVPLCHAPWNMCRNPERGKLYYSWGQIPGGVGVIDEQTGQVTAQITCWAGAGGLAFSRKSDRLYCGTWSGLAVIDGAGDSVVKSFDWAGSSDNLCWFESLDRLYCTCGPDDDVAALDCSTDSIINVVHTNYTETMILADRQKLLLCFYDGGFKGIACGDDSVVFDSVCDWNVQDYAYAAREGKVYVGRIGHLNVYNVWPFYLIKSFDWQFAGGGDQCIGYADSTHKLYWFCSRAYDHYDSIRVLDTESDTLFRTLRDTFLPRQSFVDRTGRYVWLLCTFDSTLVIYDTQADTLVLALRTPGGPRGMMGSPELGRIYLASMSSVVLVYPDSLPVGLAADFSLTREKKRSQTVMRASDVRAFTGSDVWYDASGRRVLGRATDGSGGFISPGVYFSPQPGQGRRKIVVLR
jgi:DNA-binding beta-propeller fold protein YncE